MDTVETEIMPPGTLLQVGDLVKVDDEPGTHAVVRVSGYWVFYIKLEHTVRKYGKYHQERYEQYKTRQQIVEIRRPKS